MRNLYSQSSKSPPKGRNPSEVLQQERDHLRAHYDYAVATSAIECHSDYFFRLAEGLAGLCPPSAHKGDLVVVLYSGPVPYVLREREGSTNASNGTVRYEFIGECYLQGYMDGRAIREQQEKNLPTEIFELV
jgi:hypothetical protein